MDNIIKLTNLNDFYVIVKRYNGSVFFKRKRYTTDVKGCPTNECIYTTKAEVEDAVKLLNATRKKCKYSYENASKYFVNVFIGNNWHDNVITNKFIPIKKFQTGDYDKRNVCLTLNEAIATKLVLLKKKVQDSIKDQTMATERLPKDIAEITNRYNNYMASYKAQQEQANNTMLYIKSMDIDAVVKPYETTADKIVKVLYTKG